VSLAAIGNRVDEIGQMLAAMSGQQPVAESTTGFAAQLQAARTTGAPTATTATAATAASAGATPTAFDAQIDAAATRYGLDPALLKGLIRQESGFDPNARSGAGAVGLTQLMPGTAASLGVDPADPAQAIDGGARYLKQQLDRFGGDPAKALAAYNAGPGAVAKFGGIPPYGETQNYVKSVLAFADQYRGTATTTPAALPAATTPVPAPAAGGPTLDYSTL
jgi:soluble lytic murein transglycosylase-like protein